MPFQLRRKFHFLLSEAKLLDASQVEADKLVFIFSYRFIEEQEHICRVFSFCLSFTHHKADFVIHVRIAVGKVYQSGGQQSLIISIILSLIS